MTITDKQHLTNNNKTSDILANVTRYIYIHHQIYSNQMISHLLVKSNQIKQNKKKTQTQI